MPDAALEIQLGLSIKDIEPHAWNSLVAGQSPFVQHGFLMALEQTGSVSAETGWEPCHVAVYQHGHLIAAMPLYIKHHSSGEYVFDWAWADAYRRNGLAYYPKLLTAIPFTPSQSPRILTLDSALQTALAGPIYEAVKTYAEKIDASSWHILFPDHNTAAALDTTDLIRREACQFHWHNKNFLSFDDFLATCSSRKRKNLKKERQDVAQQGFQFVRLSGQQISPEIWDKFYVFYQNTYQVRGQHGYLTRDFFSRLHTLLPDRVFLIMVSHQQRNSFVAGAMFLKDENTLFGRYWGCEHDYQNLHFETCYYQGIDICIAEKLQRFDAGAQGEHKLRRGFEPVTTCSYHWIRHPQFSEAIRGYCSQEIAHTQAYQQSARAQLPFKSDDRNTQEKSLTKECN
jgi:hypothetical protein